MDLVDAVECTITCSRCQKKIGGFGTGDYELAVEAEQLGWNVTRSGKVLCPECRRPYQNKKNAKR